MWRVFNHVCRACFPEHNKDNKHTRWAARSERWCLFNWVSDICVCGRNSGWTRVCCVCLFMCKESLCWHKTAHTHTHTFSSSVYLRHGGLHVMPASAEVVSELAQRREAQFLFELRMLLLFGRQNLLQGADLLFQLDVDTKESHVIDTSCSEYVAGRPCFSNVLWRVPAGSPLSPPLSSWGCLSWLLNLHQPLSTAESPESLNTHTHKSSVN